MDDGILLQRPDGCPSTIYHIMLGCWKKNPKERIPFHKIHKHLVDFSKEILRNVHHHRPILDSENEAWNSVCKRDLSGHKHCSEKQTNFYLLEYTVYMYTCVNGPIQKFTSVLDNYIALVQSQQLNWPITFVTEDMYCTYTSMVFLNRSILFVISSMITLYIDYC